MESPYTLAARALAERREENKAEMEKRLWEVRRAIPEFEKLEEALARNGAGLARRVLEGNCDITDLKENIQRIRKERAALMEKAGFAEDYLEDIFTCPICRDTGFLENGSRCGCMRHLAATFAGQNANLTSFMKDQTFENADFSLFADQIDDKGRKPLKFIKSAYQKAKDFAEKFDTEGRNLLLMGNAGTGKSYLSACIANRALQRGKTVYYQSAFSLFDMLEKLKFNRLEGEEAEQAEAVSRLLYQADLLIIDDLGTEFISSYSAASLFDILNNRHLQGKSMLLSTNLGMQALEQIYSARVLSRLLGDFEIIPFIGKDLRKKRLEEL